MMTNNFLSNISNEKKKNHISGRQFSIPSIAFVARLFAQVFNRCVQRDVDIWAYMSV